MTSLSTPQTASVGRSAWRTVRALSVFCLVFPACVQAPETGEGPDIDTDEQHDTGDETVEESQRPPAAEDFAALAQAARENMTQHFEVNVADWTHLSGEQGSGLFFNPNSFMKADGTLAEGDVEIELIEIFDKGSMLVTDMPSNGLTADGQVALLVSGGEHFVNATQNGEDLEMHGQFQLTAPADNTGGPDMDMQLFRADGDGEAWEVEEDDKNLRVAGEGAETQYAVFSNQFGWTNIDRWYSDPRPKTTIHVSVPSGWDDSNAAVYLSYDGEDNALARMDTYDETTGLFSEHYGLIPIGLEVHLIFITELDGQWSYAIQGTTITDGHLTDFASADDFIETDTDGLIAAINALP